MIELMDATAIKKYFTHFVICKCDGQVFDVVPCKVLEFIESLTEEQKQEQIRIFGGEEKMKEELKDCYRMEDQTLLEEYINMVILNEEWEEQMDKEYLALVGEEHIEERREAHMEKIYGLSREYTYQR